jgi:hypothetical protein
MSAGISVVASCRLVSAILRGCEPNRRCQLVPLPVAEAAAFRDNPDSERSLSAFQAMTRLVSDGGRAGPGVAAGIVEVGIVVIRDSVQTALILVMRIATY